MHVVCQETLNGKPQKFFDKLSYIYIYSFVYIVTLQVSYFYNFRDVQ